MVRNTSTTARQHRLRPTVGAVSYTGLVSEQRDQLHHLIDSLPEEQLELVLVDVRRRAVPRPAPSDKAFAWIAMGPAKNGRTDNAQRVDELLAEGFGRN
jgi:hypothetical protein